MQDLKQSLKEQEADAVQTDGDIDIEIYDERPPEDQRDPVDLDELDENDDELSDEEIAALGRRAQKRIKTLTFKYNEARRQAEQNERLSRDAIAAARRIKEQADRQQQALSAYQAQILEQRSQFSTQSVAQAEANLASALEEGDPQGIAKAQSALTDAKVAAARAQEQKDYYAAQTPRRRVEEEQDDETPRAAPRVQPSETAKQWASRNPWFGQDRELTSLAYGIHEDWVMSGKIPDTPEYYATLDRRIRELVPSKFENSGSGSQPQERTQSSGTSRKSPVAPAARSSSAVVNGKVRLSQSEVQIAERLGVPLKEYARQKLLEEQRKRGEV